MLTVSGAIRTASAHILAAAAHMSSGNGLRSSEFKYHLTDYGLKIRVVIIEKWYLGGKQSNSSIQNGN